MRSPVEDDTDETVVEVTLEGVTVDDDGTVRFAGGRDDMLAFGEAIAASTKLLPDNGDERET